MMRRPERAAGLAVLPCVVVADQLAKWWVVADVMDPPRTVVVTGFFNLVLSLNRGISFGLLRSDAPWAPWIIAVLILGVVGFLGRWLWRVRRRLPALGIGLVLGGAIGNVLDRIRLQAVVDFLQFHAFGWYFPAFNLADSAIFAGVVLILIDGLFERRTKPM